MEIRPPFKFPAAQDIETAENFLFHDHAPFPDPGWRPYTGEERKELNHLARMIMWRREGNGTPPGPLAAGAGNEGGE